MHQYRITVNGAVGPILDKLPSKQWSEVAWVCENRGWVAKLESRLVTDKDILPLLHDRKGYIVLRDVVISPWEILAGMGY